MRVLPADGDSASRRLPLAIGGDGGFLSEPQVLDSLLDISLPSSSSSGSACTSSYLFPRESTPRNRSGWPRRVSELVVELVRTCALVWRLTSSDLGRGCPGEASATRKNEPEILLDSNFLGVHVAA